MCGSVYDEWPGSGITLAAGYQIFDWSRVSIIVTVAIGPNYQNIVHVLV